MKRIKLNNKGFAITGIIYSMLILAIILMTLIILTLTRKKLLFNKMRDQILNLQEYTINYYCNVEDTEPISFSNMYVNAAKPLKQNTCVNEGYYFAGWATSDDFTEVKYTDGEIVELEGVSAGDVVNLYAVWKALKVELSVAPVNSGDFESSKVTLTATATQGLKKIKQYDFYVGAVDSGRDNDIKITKVTSDLVASIETSDGQLYDQNMIFKVVVSDEDGNTAEATIIESCNPDGNQIGSCYNPSTTTINKRYICSGSNRAYGIDVECGPVDCDNIEFGICRASCTGDQGSCYNCKTCFIQYGCSEQFEGTC